MNLNVGNPHWGWWIVWYFYLGGISAGAYFLAALVEFVGDEQDRRISRVGYLLAAPLVAVCGVLLTLDLDQPLRFWHMLFDAETFRPHMKYWSPMSIGAWALLAFGAISTISFVGALAESGRCGLGRFAALATRLHCGFFGRAFDVCGTVSGFFIAAYTGTLLTATNQPIWCDSSWIAALFLASAATTGIASIQLLSQFAEPEATAARDKLDRTDGCALWLELLVFGLFILSLSGPTHARLVKFGVWVQLAGGALACGVIVPLIVRRWPRVLGRATPIVVPVLVLVGGFLLRYAILEAPQGMLQVIDAERRSSPAGIHVAPDDRIHQAGNRLSQSKPAAELLADDAAIKLLRLIHDRLALMEQVALAKWHHELPLESADRERQQLESIRTLADERGLDADAVVPFFIAQFEAAKQVQQAWLKRWARHGLPKTDSVPDLQAELRPRLDALNLRLLDAVSEFRESQRSADDNATIRQHGERVLADLQLQPAERMALIEAVLNAARRN